MVAGALFIKGTEKSVDYKMVDLLTDKPFKNEGSDLVAFFKLSADDKDGETRKDVMEVISLIKKIVKDYGGNDVKVEINEE